MRSASFGLCLCETSPVDKGLKVIQHLTDGLSLKPCELLIILFDNVGFRV